MAITVPLAERREPDFPLSAKIAFPIGVKQKTLTGVKKPAATNEKRDQE